MRHRLTDYDWAVLASAQMGVLKSYKKNLYNSAARTFWTLNGQDVSASLHRLAEAGELAITVGGNIAFPDTPEWNVHESLRNSRREFISAWRRGEIKIVVPKQPKKGTK